jgi:alkyldihydroxyacetonephosphate synthase
VTAPTDGTVPVPLPADVSARPRLAVGWTGVDDRLLERLRAVCPVDTDPAVCAEWARDWWPLALRWAAQGGVPARAAAVARPADTNQVAAVLAACGQAGVPVTPAAGRSGVCGSSVPVSGGVVLDLRALSGIRAVDDHSLLATVGAGTYGHHLEAELRSRHGVTLGHWPQSVELSTVGGWLACRSAGQYSTRYGKIEDMVAGLEAVTADGRVWRTGGRGPRSATGPDVTQLFVGSEGTLAVITEAELRVHPVPPAERRSAWSFPDFAAGLEVCRRVLRRGATPAVLRLYDAVESARSFEVEGRAVLIVLDEGDNVLVDAVGRLVAEECDGAGAGRLDDGLVQRWLDHRNDVSALGALVQRGFVVDTAEVAGRWAVLPRLYEEVTAALGAIDGTLVASAHQSHAYSDGACLYFTFAARPPDGADADWGDRYYRAAWDAVMDAVVAAGAAVSHHHGIGLLRADALRRSLGPSHELLVALKAALDPSGVLNPGKLGLPSPLGPPAWP